LTPREERVLKLVSGAFHGREYTVGEVARRLGLGVEDVTALLESAKRKLDEADG
jgi:DNA-binding CsgD family transcriptional regulator